MSSTDDRKEQVAQEKFGASFEDLSGKDRQSVGGTVGGQKRAEGAGHEGMAEMGKKGGAVTKADTGSE
ncbi:hypothetical protein WJX72_001507 [[Myrmecia] bisecta]|uniref:Uncharacterized protein n=1 Tax=[Myrmecia] bisecta TaxID=41462 RepID=A0AAW1P6U3_9CHLO